MKTWRYVIVVETDTPKDLEDVLSKEFNKIAGHRNKIMFYRADNFKNMTSALKEIY